MKRYFSLKKLLPAVYFALICTVEAGAQCVSTDIYAFTFNGSKYELVKEKKTWSQAAACALEKKAYLVHIDNADEQAAVYSAIVAANIPTDYNPVNDAGNVSYIWIGATDKATEGAWLWDGDNNGTGVNFWNGQGSNGANDGSAAMGRYNNWGHVGDVIREPDDFNSNQDAVGIALTITPSGSTHAGEWNDIAITNTLYYVIEYGETADVNEIIPENVFALSLNPTRELLTITATTSQQLGNAYLRIFNTEGKLIIEQDGLTGNRYDIPVGTLSGGIYLIELTEKNGAKYQNKFVKD